MTSPQTSSRLLSLILKYRLWIGVVAILISIGAWWVDLAGITYVCPFCRAQRTVIGLLGVVMLFPVYGHWAVRYGAGVIGFFGAHVAAAQNFRGWARISKGEYKMHDPFYFDSFLLSGAALFIIAGLVFLLWLPKQVTED